MGVGFVFVGFVRKQNWLGAEMGLSNIPDHGLGDAGFVGVCLALVVAIALLSAYIKQSWLGFGFAAVADDEDTSRTLGIDAAAYKVTAFVIGTFLAGVAGATYAYFTRFLIPGAFGFGVSISILAMVIVGGVGSIWGVIVAAVALTLLPEFIRVVNDYKIFIYGVLLVLTMRSGASVSQLLADSSEPCGARMTRALSIRVIGISSIISAAGQSSGRMSEWRSTYRASAGHSPGRKL